MSCNSTLSAIHASRDAIYRVFARHGADPKPQDDMFRAIFCPECQSERRNQKSRVVVIGFNPATRRWTWTCQRCHQPGTRIATGDAVEAEKRFRGLGAGKLRAADFTALVHEVAGDVSAADCSTIAVTPARPNKKQAIVNSRREWIRWIITFCHFLLPPEALCLLVAASEVRCPGTYLEFAALVVKRTGMHPNTARAIVRRWHRRYPFFFEELMDKRSDADRHHFLLAACKKKVFSPGIRAVEAMLFRCIRGEGKKRPQIAAVSELAKMARCHGKTVLRWFGALKAAGIFIGEVEPPSDRRRGKSPVVGLQRNLFTDDSPATGAQHRMAEAIRDAWKGLVDEVGRRVRWGLKRFIDTVKSLSGAPSAESRSAGGG